MKVVFDPSTLRRSGTSIVAVVYLAFDGGAFPLEDWDDMVVVFARAWLDAIEAPAATVHFMEGPFVVDLTRVSPTHSRVRCIKRTRSGESVELDVVEESAALRGEVYRFAAEVASACDARGITSRDLDALRAGLAS